MRNLLFALLFVLMSSLAYAETSMYPIITIAGDAGYKTGYGLQVESSLVYRFLEVTGYAKGSLMKKKHTESGHTYGIGTQANIHLLNGFYASAGLTHSGYKSEFDNGAVWKKSGTNFGIGGGYRAEKFDVNCLYYFQENKSPNDVEFIRLDLRVKINSLLSGLVQVNRQEFLQGGKRETGITYIIGLGITF